MLLARHVARGWWLRAFLLVLLAVVELRLVFLQVIRADEFAGMGRRQMERQEKVVPRRGLVEDRRGRLMAGNVDLVSVYAHPARYRGGERGIQALGRVLAESAEDLRARLRSGRPFIWLKRRVAYENGPAAKALSKIPGLGWLEEAARVYPLGRLAGQVLGFTNVDNEGLEGLELGYEDSLKGQPGFIRVEADARGSVIAGIGDVQVDSREGVNLTLTLDARIQQIVEIELREAVRANAGKAGTAVLVDPWTGAVLAMAAIPDFDPNDPAASREEERRNRCVTDLYEPGSTFKVVTAAAALETGLFHSGDALFCENGSFSLARRIIHDHVPHAWLTLREAVERSSNIGMVKVGMRVGADAMRKEALSLGFGEKSGIDLPGEVSGLVKPLPEWTESALASISYGQEVLVTALQTAMATAAVANGGDLLQPYVVEEVRNRQGRLIERHGRRVRRRAFTEQTARELAAFLQGVVEKGTGMPAKPEGYSAAGKTGTASKADPKTGTYPPGRYIVSFAGYSPAEKPKVVAVVVIDEPALPGYGGTIAGPAFARMMDRILPYLGLPRGGVPARALEESGSQASRSIVPELAGLSQAEALETAKAAGLEPVAEGGEGPVREQGILPGTLVRRGSRIHLGAGAGEGPSRMPDLRGRSLRAALAALGGNRPRVRLEGSGWVVAQSPAPGTVLGPDSLCVLKMSLPGGNL